MSLEEALVRRLRAEIEHELGRLERLREAAADAPRTADPYAVRARGSILHDLYNGMERIFGRIADDVDGGRPHGDAGHQRLIRSMTLRIDGVRPGVITPELGTGLCDFLGFRHVFWNIYGDELDVERVALLEARLPKVLDDFERQLCSFLDWMTGPLQESPVTLSGRTLPSPIHREPSESSFSGPRRTPPGDGDVLSS